MTKGTPFKVIVTSIGGCWRPENGYLHATVVILRGNRSKTPGEHLLQFSNKKICPKFRNHRDTGYSEVWQGTLLLKNYLP